MIQIEESRTQIEHFYIFSILNGEFSLRLTIHKLKQRWFIDPGTLLAVTN